MARRRPKINNKFDYNNLTANDVLCPVCRSILIRPITLPCSHGFCSSCFEETSNSLQDANQVCPLCSVRVGSWLRTATKSKKLVNETFWQAIQNNFPQQVKNKLDGNGYKMVNEPTKNEVENASFLNDYANKEYTCRILCQETVKLSNDLPKNNDYESLTVIQRKNKRIQKITESEERSNSIDSECLYFKPVEYKNNPTIKRLPPIRVPTKKPDINANAKFSTPSGKMEIEFSIHSAFVKVSPPTIVIEESEDEDEEVISKSDTKSDADQTKINRNGQNNKTRRVVRKIKSRRNVHKAKVKPKKNGVIKKMKLPSKPKANSITDLKKVPNCTINIITREKGRERTVQEKADYELAKELQKQFNQYSTRSVVKVNNHK